MPFVSRVLPAEPFIDLDAYEAAGGGEGLKAARKVDPEVVIGEVEASGLRGRGGAGFPTGVKWRTVASYESATADSTVVVNGAEGEPGTFKDRAILRANPYAVLEGALIAALAVGAGEIVVALKGTFTVEADRVRAAAAEMKRADWPGGIPIHVFDGPGAYLYGEETALLEALDGRPPFPRVSPPYREGVDEPSTSAEATMAGAPDTDDAAPVLVNNVETLANVPGILANGAAWFREVGTEEFPGTLVCTVSGSTVNHGVAEVAMGTPLRQVIDEVGGMRPGHALVGVLSGVSAAPLLGDETEGFGSGSFIVLDDDDDVVATMAGASRFLAVESCGQCVPCKRDGLELAGLLAKLSRSEADEADMDMINSLVDTVADEARCALARQHEAVVRGFLERFPAAVDAHVRGTTPPTEPALVAELRDIKGGVADVDETHRDKQPDWTYNEDDSGKYPVEIY